MVFGRFDARVLALSQVVSYSLVIANITSVVATQNIESSARVRPTLRVMRDIVCNLHTPLSTPNQPWTDEILEGGTNDLRDGLHESARASSISPEEDP